VTSKRDRFKKFANDAHAHTGLDATFLKFGAEVGVWSVGKDDNYTDYSGRELLADVPDLMHGWRKFVNTKPVTPVYAISRVDDDASPPLREMLGDHDEREWQRDKFSGSPRDPWVWVSALPFIDPDTGDTLAFVTESSGGHDAVGALADAFAAQPEDTDQLPRVCLASHSRVGSNGKRYHFPILRILRWEPRPANARHLLPPPSPVPAAAAQRELDLGGHHRGNGHAPESDIPF
jgi:hypothetical protein